jgi:hypothetical protein
MAHVNTIMSQLLPLIPRHVFEHIVDTHAWQGPKPRTFTYWSQLVAMLYGQLGGRNSLRDLVFSLNQQAPKLYHLGQAEVRRSTLAEANEQRPAVIFEQTYHKLLARVYAEMARQEQVHPELKIIDATTIELGAGTFPWATFRARKGAIKLHALLADLLPQCVVLTDGKTHDLTVARDLTFAPGDLLVFDRAYIDYDWLFDLHQQGVWFVTRLKTHACYEVLEDRACASEAVLADQVIRLSSPHGQAAYPSPLRRVRYRDPESGKEYVFLTNRLDLTALEIAALSAPLANRALFQVDQTTLENQGLLRHLEERRPHPGLDRLDRLSAAILAETAEHRGLELAGTHPPGANHAHGTMPTLGDSLSPGQSTAPAIVFV